jgi:hypothetical protein
VVRFDGGVSRGHVESLFLKLNLPDARALWLKLTFLSRTIGKAEQVAEGWAIAFNLDGQARDMSSPTSTVALKQTWPASDAEIAKDCLYVRVGGVEMYHGRTRGELRDPDSGEHIQWDLSYSCEHTGFRHLPYGWMYKGPIPKTKAATPQMQALFSGVVTVNGELSSIRDAPGMLGHNWGRQHAEHWVWAHCNRWVESDEVAFEGVSSKVKLGPFTTPQLTALMVRMPGERVIINGLWALIRNESQLEGLSWSFSGQRGDRRISGWFKAPPDRFVGVDYHDPDGRIVHCLNSKIAHGMVTISAREGSRWQPMYTLHTEDSAALEFGLRGETLGVPIQIR